MRIKSTTDSHFIYYSSRNTFIVEGVKEAIWLGGMIGELEITQACEKIQGDRQISIYFSNHLVSWEDKEHQLFFALYKGIDLFEGDCVWEDGFARLYNICCSLRHRLDQCSIITETWSSFLEIDSSLESDKVVDG